MIHEVVFLLLKISLLEPINSILEIQKYSKYKIFHFRKVNIGEVGKEILKLDKTKASQNIDIPTRNIEENIDIFTDFLCTSINHAVKPASFPSFFKLVDVTPLHKIKIKDMKENFRSVKILPKIIKYPGKIYLCSNVYFF